MSTLYLVDGNSQLYRSFYAIQGLTTSSGFPTNAIFGFTNTLLKIINDYKPTHIAVAFDYPAPSFRQMLQPNYKSNRQKMPEDLIKQIPIIKQILSAFRINVVEVPGLEADDVIATLTDMAKKDGFKVVIVSSDKDLFQLVEESVLILDTRDYEIIGKEEVINKFGIPPEKIPLFLAFTGDASDNIKGITGIGKVTARKLLEKYGSIDEIIKNEKDNPRIKNLIDNIETFHANLKLTLLKRDISLNLKISELKLQEPAYSELAVIFKQFELKKFLSILPVAKETGTESKRFELQIDFIDSEEKFMELEELIAQSDAFAFLLTEDLIFVNLGERKTFVVSMNLTHVKDLFKNMKQKKFCYDLKSQLKISKIPIPMNQSLYDVMIIDYLLEPDIAERKLQRLILSYLREDYEEKIIVDNLEIKAQHTYFIYQIGKKQENMIDEELLNLYTNLELPLCYVLADMEETGIKIDIERLDALKQQITERLRQKELEIYNATGTHFNINSPKQLGEVLYEKLKLPPARKIKTGFSTDQKELERLTSFHIAPALILEYRTLTKLLDTYIQPLPQMVEIGTKRLHTTFNQVTVATGRLSSSEPNLQNIPTKTSSMGKEIREVFISDKDYKLISLDYSQIELRVLAHFSQDPLLIESFLADEDIHTNVASSLFGISKEDVSPEYRRIAKTINFGIIYGISPYGLATQLGIDNSSAKKYIESFFSKYKGVKEYISSIINEAREKGFVKSILGRKRFIPNINSANKNIRLQAERIAVNTPIQASAADIIKMAMIKIHEYLENLNSNDSRNKNMKYTAKILLQIHDELILEVLNDKVDDVLNNAKSIMENVINLNVPLKVNFSVGTNWSEL